MHIFITGATGFVGGTLTETLLKQDHDVYALVRSPKKADELVRSIPEKHRHQLHILYGDISQPGLGLSVEDHSILHGKIDAVYHIAALVKFNPELRDELFTVNYEGTRHVLTVARSWGVRSFYYVSTAYTLGKQEHGAEAMHPKEGPFYNPYEESKCKAEHLVFSYRDQMNTTIFRPSIIVGDSVSGKSNSTVALYGFIRGLHVFKKRVLRQSSAARTYRIEASAHGTSNLVPVDYVCRVLAAALLHAKPNMIYSITNSAAPTNRDILALVCDHLGITGRLVPDEAPTNLTREEQALNGLVAAYHAYLQRHITFEDTNTRAMLQAARKEPLHMDLTMLRRIIGGYELEMVPV